MGSSPSKRVEIELRNSPSFQSAVANTYEECMNLTQHAFPGPCLYQLLHASTSVYTLLLSSSKDDPAAKIQQKWLPQPPTQLQIDRTLRKLKLLCNGKSASLNLEEFQAFILALFRDMALSNAFKSMAFYIPVGFLAILSSHLIAQRLPLIGPTYRTQGPKLPRIMAGYTAGTAAAVYINL
uniref:Uncharacterized protein n=1 Tax=Picea sitchensis TaxID=3332 RepID=D5A923_PICSI|nr:unknown [Picea sitchensis]